MLRIIVVAASQFLALSSWAQGGTCTHEHVFDADLQEPIPFEPGKAIEALSEFFECTLSIPKSPPVYGEDGSIIGRAAGFYAEETMMLGGIPSSNRYWIIEDTESGRDLAIEAGAVDMKFSGTEWVGIALDSEGAVVAEYNPEVPDIGLALSGPAKAELQPSLSDYVAVAVANQLPAIRPRDIYGVTFVSTPVGAEVWIGSDFYDNTEMGLIVGGADIDQVQMTMEGYEDCGRGEFMIIEAGYGTMTISCEMIQAGAGLSSED